jgi:tetratricopeptide (TPR) repeat protein
MKSWIKGLVVKYYERIAFNSFISGKYSRAEYCYLKVNSLWPNKEGINYNLGLTYFSMNFLDDAVSFVEKERELYGNSYEVDRTLADIYFQQINRELANKYYHLAYDYGVNEKIKSFINARINITSSKEKYDKAVEAMGVFKEANSFFDEQKFEEALPCYEKVVELDPTNVMAMNNIGVIYMNYIINFDLAEEMFKKAFELVDMPIVRSNYEKILRHQKRRGQSK